MRRATILLLFLPSLVGACRRGDDSAAFAGVDTTRFRAVKRMTRAAHEGAPRLALEPVRRLCGAGGPPPCELRGIAFVVVRPEGSAIVGDGGTVVRQFDAAGRHVRDIGRTGSGPGEFRSTFAAGLDSLGALTIFDVWQRRIVRFDSGGRVVETRRAHPPPTLAGAGVAAGRVVYVDIPGALRVGDTVTASFAHDTAGGGAPGTLATVRTRSRTTPGSNMVPIASPLAVRPVWDIGRDGSVAFSNGDRFRLEWFDAGRPAVVLAADVPLRPVTRREVDSVRAALTRPATGRPPLAPPALARLHAALDSAPPTHAAITALRLLRDGTLWVRGDPALPGGRVRWDAFARDGAHLGWVALSAASTIAAGARDTLVVVERDGVDVPSVVWYRVVR